ncbi:LysR family transcriptional regulator, partial [Streptomyces tricolor]|nr:LysR family transcriptional regulator [Streptomyces tricolor]
PDLAIRPLKGDPLGVRLLLAARTEADLDHAFPELEQAYWTVAQEAPAYREWLNRAHACAAPERPGALAVPGLNSRPAHAAM